MMRWVRQTAGEAEVVLSVRTGAFLLADAGLLAVPTLWVASDHGFSQHTGSVDLGAVLAPFAGAPRPSRRRSAASGDLPRRLRRRPRDAATAQRGSR